MQSASLGVFSLQLSPPGAANSTFSPLVPGAINGAIPNLPAETHLPAGAVVIASPGKTSGAAAASLTPEITIPDVNIASW